MAVNEERRQQLNTARRKRYWLKKRRGQCVKDGCYVRTHGTVKCEKHTIESTKHTKKWRHSYRGRHKTRIGLRRLIAKRAAAGLCTECGSDDLASERRCKKCQARDRKRYKHIENKKCSICREPGHNKRSCHRRFSVDVDLVFHATERTPITMYD